MLALALTNKKDFMNKFLKTEIFDHFLLQEGIVVSFASYVIDGTITKGFYTDTEAEELGIKTFHFLPFEILPIPNSFLSFHLIISWQVTSEFFSLIDCFGLCRYHALGRLPELFPDHRLTSQMR